MPQLRRYPHCLSLRTKSKGGAAPPADIRSHSKSSATINNLRARASRPIRKLRRPIPIDDFRVGAVRRYLRHRQYMGGIWTQQRLQRSPAVSLPVQQTAMARLHAHTGALDAAHTEHTGYVARAGFAYITHHAQRRDDYPLWLRTCQHRPLDAVDDTI